MSDVQIDSSNWPSVNKLTAPLVQYIVDNAAALRVGVEKHATGATIVDAGIKSPGGLEVGRLVAEICMGGLGHVSLHNSATFAHWPWM
ncbi:MAG TPA: methenyltetrahydromethanopterin cyclohydrolase, partial [Methyloradius sp.]